MADLVILTAEELDGAAYVAVALAADDPEMDVLAGITTHTLLARPNLPAAQVRDAIATLQAAIVANRASADLSPNAAIKMSRILTRVVPGLTTPVLTEGARSYTRAFLGSLRRGTPVARQVAPVDLQFDRLGEVSRFRADTWRQLHQLARGRPAVAGAVDQSAIAQALGVETTQVATQLLDQVPLEPLKTFVAAHPRPDGGLSVPAPAVDSVLADVTGRTRQLRQSYADNLVALDGVQQQTMAKKSCEALGTENGEEEEKSELEKAIEKAEAKQKELDETLKDVIKGTKGTFGVLSFIAGRFDSELGKDVEEYGQIVVTVLEAVRDFSEAAVGVAKALEGLIDASASELLLYGSLGFSVAMIAVAIQLSGLLGNRTKPITQVILEELREVRKLLVDLQASMRTRFDRIERRLDRMYAGILSRLAEIDFDVGQIEGNVEELQLSLYGLHAELERLNRNVHGFLEAEGRRPLVEAMNGFLNFRELTGTDLSFAEFRKAETVFFSWGRDHSKDVLQAGLEDRSFADDDVFTEVATFPLATNVNYLRLAPSERFGLGPLSPNRLANPFDWIVACEAYAQLSEEWPDHAAQMSPSRVAALADAGETLGASLSRITDLPLFTALADHYLAAFGQLKDAINAVEIEFRVDPDTQLQGIDMWGGVEQEPSRHFFTEAFDHLPRCGGGNFDDLGNETVPTRSFDFDVSDLVPFMIASNLRASLVPGVRDGLERLSACARAFWREVGRETLGVGGLVRITYRLSIAAEIRYGQAPVCTYRFDTEEPHGAVVRQSDLGTFDPADDRDPHALLLNEDGKRLWMKLAQFPVRRVVDEPRRRATASLVQEKLKLLQRAFYAEVARRFGEAGDSVQQMGRRLSGSKLLVRAFVATGFPLSLEANEILRSLLFGSDAILAGTETDGDDGRLDDMQDVYAFFSARAEDPLPVNILGELEKLIEERLQRLRTLLTEIIDDIATNGEPEPPELFAPTLLRLRLLTG